MQFLNKLVGSCIILFLPIVGWTQKNELAFSIGSVTASERQPLKLGADTALQINYGRRLFEFNNVALYGEVHFLASPNREVTAGPQIATRDVASLYLTPGLRLKFLPKAKLSPFVAIGGGLALYEQSTKLRNNQANPVSRELTRGAFNFGGGADLRIWRSLSLRSEFRDFITGSPNYNLPSIRGTQHNPVISGGIVLQWH